MTQRKGDIWDGFEIEGVRDLDFETQINVWMRVCFLIANVVRILIIMAHMILVDRLCAMGV